MRIAARDIWNTRIQATCGVIACEDGHGGTEIYLSGNFGQCADDPPMVIVNPSVVYPIEGAIRRHGRFSISVLRDDQREWALRLIDIRRRQPNKAAVTGIPITTDARHGIPWVPDCMQVLFCEANQILDTGDHTVVICRLLESRPVSAVPLPLLYPRISGGRRTGPAALLHAVRPWLRRTGAEAFFRRLLKRMRAEQPPDLPGKTYRDGGCTDAQLDRQRPFGFLDRGRSIAPPPATSPALLTRKVPICVVGIGAFGALHCRMVKAAGPNAELWVCGRTEDRTARFAARAGAAGYVVGAERAAVDPRFVAVSIVLPHHLHRQAVEAAAAGGKHILVEKPIANTLRDADAMIAAARRAGVRLMVAENTHFRPDVAAAANAIARGDIGEPLYWNARAGGLMRPWGWKASAATMGGGLLLDLGIHYVRILRLLMGEPDRVLATKAMQVHMNMEGEDSAHALFSSPVGWRGHLLASWSSPRGDAPDVVVSGERGELHLWGNRPFYDFYPAAPTPVSQLLSLVRPSWLAERLARPSHQRIRRRLDVARAWLEYTGYAAEVREFLLSIQDDREPATGGEDGRRDLEIALAATSSLATESWVAIPRSS